MSYYVYILYSRKADRYYVGQSDNLEERLESHLSGISRYTAIADDWRLQYTEAFETRTNAVKQVARVTRKCNIIYFPDCTFSQFDHLSDIGKMIRTLNSGIRTSFFCLENHLLKILPL